MTLTGDFAVWKFLWRKLTLPYKLFGNPQNFRESLICNLTSQIDINIKRKFSLAQKQFLCLYSPLGGSPVDMRSGSINCEMVEVVVNCTANPTGNLLPNLFGTGLSGPGLRIGNSDRGKKTHLF